MSLACWLQAVAGEERRPAGRGSCSFAQCNTISDQLSDLPIVTDCERGVNAKVASWFCITRVLIQGFSRKDIDLGPRFLNIHPLMAESTSGNHNIMDSTELWVWESWRVV